jgi:hypothetical protein
LGLAAGVIFLLVLAIGSKTPAPSNQNDMLSLEAENFAVQSSKPASKQKSTFQTTSRGKATGPTLE